MWAQKEGKECGTREHLFSWLPLQIFQNASVKLQVMNWWADGDWVQGFWEWVKYGDSVTLKKKVLVSVYWNGTSNIKDQSTGLAWALKRAFSAGLQEGAEIWALQNETVWTRRAPGANPQPSLNLS